MIKLTDTELKVVEVLNFVATFDGIIENESERKYIIQEGLNKFIPNYKRPLMVISKKDGSIKFRVINTLSVTSNHKGGFHSANLNGVRMSKDETFEILGILNYSGWTLEHHLEQFGMSNPDFICKYMEKDVS